MTMTSFLEGRSGLHDGCWFIYDRLVLGGLRGFFLILGTHGFLRGKKKIIYSSIYSVATLSTL